MYGEINMENCTTIYKIDIQWEFAIISQETQSGAQPREVGWGVKWERIYVYLWLINFEV